MSTKRFSLLILSTISAILLHFIFSCQGYLSVPEKHVPLFVFGDSTFDPGNNNYINTIDMANYYPYGETFFKYPTGRFSDGRIIPDFIAEYAKLPLIPPYLHPGNLELSYGVNFASAGSGALVESNQGMTIDLGTQLRYFKNVTEELRQKLGDEMAKDLLSRAVHLFSVGGNDYVFPFTMNSAVLQSYLPAARIRRTGNRQHNCSYTGKEIYKIGGRKFGFVNLWPFACVPYLRVLIGVENNGACFDQITPYIQLHNKETFKLLLRLENELEGFRYSLLDFYSFLKDRMNRPSKYGFKEGNVACCGSGPYRGILNCGGKRGVTQYYLCDNTSEYVFFDSSHLTERAYQQFSKRVWTGKSSFAGPHNLKALFKFY